MKLLKSKKGTDWASYLMVAVILFALGITVIIGKLAIDKIDQSFNSSSDLPAEARTVVKDFNANYVTLWDNLFMTIFIGIAIGMLISVYFIRSNPIFYIIFMFIMATLSFISFFLADFFFNLMSASELSGYAIQFTKMNVILGAKFPLWFFLIGIIMGVIMYAKGGESG